MSLYPSDEKFLAALPDEKRAEFLTYVGELDKENWRRGGEGSFYQTTGLECWFDYFNDGYSPTAALDEDASYD